MYETFQLVRIGVFKINEACRSIDITKDSKYLIVSATTVGLQFYDIGTGRRLHEVKVPGVNSKIVALNYGDTEVLCLYDHEKRSYIRSYKVADILSSATNAPKEQFEV